MGIITAERRDANNNGNENCWVRTLPDGTVEHYSKDFYNSDFTEKKKTKEELLEEIERELL